MYVADGVADGVMVVDAPVGVKVGLWAVEGTVGAAAGSEFCGVACSVTAGVCRPPWNCLRHSFEFGGRSSVLHAADTSRMTT